MQMAFANGLETPLFEAIGVYDGELNTFVVENVDDIRFVSMRVWGS